MRWKIWRYYLDALVFKQLSDPLPVVWVAPAAVYENSGTYQVGWSSGNRRARHLSVLLLRSADEETARDRDCHKDRFRSADT